MKKEDRNKLRHEFFAQLENNPMDLREALRTIRKIAGKTQTDYAKLVGIAPRVLIDLERGVGNPTLKTLEKLLTPFGLEIKVCRRKSKL